MHYSEGRKKMFVLSLIQNGVINILFHLLGFRMSILLSSLYQPRTGNLEFKISLMFPLR